MGWRCRLYPFLAEEPRHSPKRPFDDHFHTFELLSTRHCGTNRQTCRGVCGGGGATVPATSAGCHPWEGRPQMRLLQHLLPLPRRRCCSAIAQQPGEAQRWSTATTGGACYLVASQSADCLDSTTRQRHNINCQQQGVRQPVAATLRIITKKIQKQDATNNNEKTRNPARSRPHSTVQ